VYGRRGGTWGPSSGGEKHSRRKSTKKGKEKGKSSKGKRAEPVSDFSTHYFRTRLNKKQKAWEGNTKEKEEPFVGWEGTRKMKPTARTLEKAAKAEIKHQ